MPLSTSAANSGDIGQVTPPTSIASGELPELLDRFAGVLLSVASLVAALILIIGGIMYSLAAGEEIPQARAKRAMKWAVFGLMIALLSYTIMRTVASVLS
ncbi:hypothetical protein HZA38_04820 [Candidatus Peregrinibacteria bacterium]|nr:hypothetical protein [Candidatus Peregrinibacteria bacterium]